MLSVSEASPPPLSETLRRVCPERSEWAQVTRGGYQLASTKTPTQDSVGATFMVARGWGCGPFSDEPASSDNPPRATMKVAVFSG
jgi:hypothetical protein